jgi:signal transduction histidine kinase
MNCGIRPGFALARQHDVPYSDTECHELISLIAHEVRSPAAVVAGYLRLLLKGTAQNAPGPERNSPEAERHMIEEANRSCGRLLGLVQQLGELAILEESDAFRSPAHVYIFLLCEEVVRAAALEGGAATFSCADVDRRSIVGGDADRLKQALAALVAVVLRERGARQLEVFGFVSREHGSPRAVIALGDPGTAARRDDILANRGASFDRWRGGTGMSLPITYRIVEAHGGSLWSLPGESHAACALSLPLAKVPFRV